MCLVWCWLIVTQGTPSLALCVANLVVTGNCSEQFRLNLQKHADTTSVSRTTDFESDARFGHGPRFAKAFTALLTRQS